MEENNGWIHLFRKFIDWEWYDCPNVKIVFLHCLLMANHKTGKWQGITIKRGQFISSYEKIAAANGLTSRQVRYALDKLKTTREIVTQTTNLYTLITVNNYDLYQDTLSNKCKTNVKQMSTNKNDKNIDSINTSYINSLSIQKNETPKLSKEEREILKSYSKKNGAKNINAYIRKLVENGDYLEILETEKEKQEKRRAEKARFLVEKQEQTKETELTQEERQAALEKARELAGITKIRRKQHG